eukprot:1667838-Prymnesium_polylepis.1
MHGRAAVLLRAVVLVDATVKPFEIANPPNAHAHVEQVYAARDGRQSVLESRPSLPLRSRMRAPAARFPPNSGRAPRRAVAPAVEAPAVEAPPSWPPASPACASPRQNSKPRCAARDPESRRPRTRSCGARFPGRTRRPCSRQASQNVNLCGWTCVLQSHHARAIPGACGAPADEALLLARPVHPHSLVNQLLTTLRLFRCGACCSGGRRWCRGRRRWRRGGGRRG